MNVSKKVVYSGRVQGVGFRYTTLRLAEGLAVGGYVKNLPDGNVELVVEGPATEIEQLLDRIAQHMAGYIHGSQVASEPAHGFQGFRIDH